ncbi:MAG: serine hydrolase [Pseudomonadota bacterium]
MTSPASSTYSAFPASRPRIGRRRVLAGLAAAPAALALPSAAARASAAPDWSEAARRAASLDQLHALAIHLDGAPAFAQGFRGRRPDRLANVKSVSKTLVALLTGLAIDAGALPGPEARLGDVAPELIPLGADRRVADIAVAHLLTMTAGLERTSGAGYGPWVQSRDWVAYALSRPMVAAPGAAFQYSTGTFHVLGAVLSRVAGRSLHQLARDGLARPLGIEIPPWTRDPQGRFMGGNEMALSPVALARLGAMIAAGGVWEGTQIVPRAWIEASWTPRARSPWSGDLYGYGWFLRELGGRPVAYGRGYGGQMLYVFAEERLSVAISSDPMRPARSGGYVSDLHALVEETILRQLPGR